MFKGISLADSLFILTSSPKGPVDSEPPPRVQIMIGDVRLQAVTWTNYHSHHMASWWFNSSPPSATYSRQWNGSALVQLMACRLFGAKSLPEPMLAYCQLDSREHISVKFESEFYHFHSRKCIWKCRLPEWRPFCSVGDDIIHRYLLFNKDGKFISFISLDSKIQIHLLKTHVGTVVIIHSHRP